MWRKTPVEQAWNEQLVLVRHGLRCDASWRWRRDATLCDVAQSIFRKPELLQVFNCCKVLRLLATEFNSSVFKNFLPSRFPSAAGFFL